jgi:hypothetical protein
LPRTTPELFLKIVYIRIIDALVDNGLCRVIATLQPLLTFKAQEIGEMELQISSGQGPVECELAVAKLLSSLAAKFPDIAIIEETVGSRNGGSRSMRISSETDLSFLEGTVL